MQQLFDQAREYLDGGLSLVPIGAKSKAPAVSWKQYQERQPTEAELKDWLNKFPGIGILGGKVSGNLEILDLESIAPLDEFCRLVDQRAPELLAKLPHVKTPSGGRHIYYRCEGVEVEGNQKLAERAIPIPDESLPRNEDGTLNESEIRKSGYRKKENQYFQVKTLIETRGEGGQVLSPLCPPGVHPNGGVYCLLSGNLGQTPTITAAEREILLSAARACNEFGDSEKAEGRREAASTKISGRKPGQDFNDRSGARGRVRDLLKEHGWSRFRNGSKGELWSRPGVKDHGSATLFDDGAFYVFSTNATPFDAGRSYLPFAVYAYLKHGGDFATAAKALAKEGYGDQKKPDKKGANKPKKTQQQVGMVNFIASESGVWATDEDGNKTWICSQLAIEADTRDENSENWGRLLAFIDRDNVEKRWAMPMQLLAGDGREFREQLLNLGLVIAPGAKARHLLSAYLNTKPEKKALCVTKQGWHRGVYVLPDETIGESPEAVYLQTVSANQLFRQAGTVSEWRDQIGRYCSGNSRLILAASIAFASPLLEVLQGENGGWHFTGATSKGKTTALFVAGSVFGGGGDKGFIRRWRATVNGLESVAESHHDALLCLDEIAECRPDDVNEAAYMLANGQGKARQHRGGGLRRTAEWRLVFLSSGEVSIADHVAQSGRRVRGGQEVRVINLPAEADKGLGLFEEIHDFKSADEFARHLQRSARDHYGAPIRAFLGNIATHQDEIRKAYQIFDAELLKEMLPDSAASEVGRVAHRFALAAFAGERATDLGITGWQPDEATAAAKSLFQSWLSTRGTHGSVDEESALSQVAQFIESHGSSRFQRVDATGSAKDEKIINRAGYVEESGDDGLIYYFTPEVFRGEVCRGFDHKVVAKALLKRDGLLTSHDLRYEKRFPEGKKKVYAVLSKAFE